MAVGPDQWTACDMVILEFKLSLVDIIYIIRIVNFTGSLCLSDDTDPLAKLGIDSKKIFFTDGTDSFAHAENLRRPDPRDGGQPTHPKGLNGRALCGNRRSDSRARRGAFDYARLCRFTRFTF